MEVFKEFWPKRLPHTLTIPNIGIHDNLRITVEKYPDKPALHYYGTTYTYQELYDQVLEAAAFLQKQLDVIKGERILLYMQNSPSFIISYYAILMAGAVVVPVNPMNKTEEISFYRKDCEARYVMAGQELLSNVLPLLTENELKCTIVASYGDFIKSNDSGFSLPKEVQLTSSHLKKENRIISWDTLKQANLTYETVPIDIDELACLPYTSGTTGNPKGCMHTHRTIQANVIGTAAWMSMTSDAVHLTSLPLFHVTGMQHSMNAPIYTGSSMVLMTRWDRNTAVDLLGYYQCTNWINISTMVVDFLSKPDIEEKDLHSLKIVGGGGAPLPKAIGEKLERLTGITYCEGYGLSETISQTHFNPPDRPKLQCLGIPSFDVSVKIIDQETEEEVPAGAEGEIAVNGPQVFDGYWKRPDENQKVFFEADGKRFFRTGDIGYQDEDGYFFMVDRKKRMINVSGYKVWPAEVEAKLYSHPVIEQACIVGAPHPRSGETVKAYLVPKENVSNEEQLKEEIIAWTKEKMAAYKSPTIIEFINELPKTASGKILWRHLQDKEFQK
ncbi:long-chain-fatty-acid--CoA ligase [Alteribacillus sp. YIM 98480]|uniref:long-chain-fatty-acid--CoA ligase n=1 Tax=Alteribacillus sp. YIM 98480 TaxID=2606599 RepID=UPI00131C5E3F|nr:long-chain-fatty-acid--CoA ligase [Alteribacillus sp. YIM 98480]